jgi:hypothetical protein
MQPTEFQRVVSLDAGVAMVVTDLHGDWDAYSRYRDRFLTLQAQGSADYLILAGDLIHSEGVLHTDRSVDIVLDLLKLRQALGERLIYLLGNHELPHLYGIPLQKGAHLYTPTFEAAMGEHRRAILTLFDSLPFYVRTRAGVSICHAGATAEMDAPGAAARLFWYSHRRIMGDVAASLPVDQRSLLRVWFGRVSGVPYQDMARRYLAVSGPDDPRYDDLLIGMVASGMYSVTAHPDFDLLWAAFFTRNEGDYGRRGYAVYLNALLRELAAEFCPQEVLVTGHIVCQGGYTLVTDRQLRLASGSHARPHQAACCLLFDVEKPVRRADELLSGLENLFKVL